MKKITTHTKDNVKVFKFIEDGEINAVGLSALDDAIARLVAAEANAERKQYLKELLDDTWFASAESVQKFVTQNQLENETIWTVASMYVQES